MDVNKLKKLKEIGYVIKKTCSTCCFSKFQGKDFGECLKFDYEHEKHSNSLRGLSINVNGFCLDYKSKDDRDHKLHGFCELIEEDV